jgi:uncharacterized protein (TIGR00266 family)
MDYQQQPQGGHPIQPQGQAMPQAYAPQGSSTQFEVTHGPSFAMLRVAPQPGQVIISQAGAMVARNHSVGMEVKMNAGLNPGFFGKLKTIMIAFIRKLVGGETFFVNHFSTQQGGSVWLAPTMAGPVTHRYLNGERITLSTGAFLASSGNVDMRVKFGGLRAIFAREGAFFLECFGTGDLWFTSYGGIEAIDVNGSYIVDNGHLVGFEGNLTFNIRSAGGGAMGFLASGEGLVCEFTGQGRVYIQSRNVSSLVGWLSGML